MSKLNKRRKIKRLARVEQALALCQHLFFEAFMALEAARRAISKDRK